MANTVTAAKKQGETLQIVILTLFMTAGFFALLTIGLAFFMPSRERAVQVAIADLEEFVTPKGAGRNSPSWTKRNQIEQLKKSGIDVDLRTVINDQFQGLVPNRFPPLSEKPVAAKSKTIASTQDVRFTGLSMQEIVNFVARVRDANSSIHVVSFDLTRSRSRATGDDLLWDSNITFAFYQNPEVKAEFQKRERAAAARKETEAPPEDKKAPADGKPAEKPAPSEG